MYILNFKYGKKSLKAFKGAERGSLKTRDRVTVFLPRAQNRNVRKMGHHPLLFENLSWFFLTKISLAFCATTPFARDLFSYAFDACTQGKDQIIKAKKSFSSSSPHFICHLCIFLEAQEKASLMQKKVFRILFDVK